MALVASKKGFSVTTVAKGQRIVKATLLIVCIWSCRILVWKISHKNPFAVIYTSLNPKKAQLLQFAHLLFIREVDIKRTAVLLDTIEVRCSFYCRFSITTVIDKPKLMMDRPVEKWHVAELKRFLRHNNISIKGLKVKAQFVEK